MDIRVQTSFLNNPKRIKLFRLLSGKSPSQRSATDFLLNLWFATAMNKPTGVLTGWSVEDIEIACDWDGNAGELVEALINVGFLDCIIDGKVVFPEQYSKNLKGIYAVHDWQEHNPYVATREERHLQAKKAAFIKHHGKAEGTKRYQNYLNERGVNNKSNISESPVISRTTEETVTTVCEEQVKEIGEIIDYYEQCTENKILSENIAIAKFNIGFWLNKYSKTELLKCINRYYKEFTNNKTESKFRKHCSNFFAVEGDNKGFFLKYYENIGSDDSLKIEAEKCLKDFNGNCSQKIRGTLDICSVCDVNKEKLITKQDFDNMEKNYERKRME